MLFGKYLTNKCVNSSICSVLYKVSMCAVYLLNEITFSTIEYFEVSK